jgi:hypothetical protein
MDLSDNDLCQRLIMASFSGDDTMPEEYKDSHPATIRLARKNTLIQENNDSIPLDLGV